MIYFIISPQGNVPYNEPPHCIVLALCVQQMLLVSHIVGVKLTRFAVLVVILSTPSGIGPWDAVGDPYLSGGGGYGWHCPHFPGQQRPGLLACGSWHVLHHHVPSAGLHPLLQGVQWLWSLRGLLDGDHHEGPERRAAHRPRASHQVPWLPAGRGGKAHSVLPIPHHHHDHFALIHSALLLAGIHHFQQGSAVWAMGCVQSQTHAETDTQSRKWQEDQLGQRGRRRGQTATGHHQLLKRLGEDGEREDGHRLEADMFVRLPSRSSQWGTTAKAGLYIQIVFSITVNLRRWHLYKQRAIWALWHRPSSVVFTKEYCKSRLAHKPLSSIAYN